MYHALWTLESFAQRRSLIKTLIPVFAFYAFIVFQFAIFLDTALAFSVSDGVEGGYNTVNQHTVSAFALEVVGEES